MRLYCFFKVGSSQGPAHYAGTTMRVCCLPHLQSGPRPRIPVCAQNLFASACRYLFMCASLSRSLSTILQHNLSAQKMIMRTEGRWRRWNYWAGHWPWVLPRQSPMFFHGGRLPMSMLMMKKPMSINHLAPITGLGRCCCFYYTETETE